MATLLNTQKRRAMQKLWSKLDEHLLPNIGSGVALALSGGPDSRALLEAVASWPHRLAGRFLAISFDHGVRAPSLAESEFVLKRAKRLGFDVYLERMLNIDINGEMELRSKRYNMLAQICLKHDLKNLCTAHHMDDNAEGFMMGLLGVGGGAMGAAMNESEDLASYKLLRPFLGLRKNELRLALNLNQISDYAFDSLDEAQKGSRAMVRHSVLPRISKLYANFSTRLDLFAKNQRRVENTLVQPAMGLLSFEENRAIININPKLSPLIIAKAVKLAMKKLGAEKDVRSAAPILEEIIKKLQGAKIKQDSEKGGLDRPAKWFNVNDLNARVYSLPGVKLVFGQGKIVVEQF